ncbi:Thiamine-phosphate synthase [Galdieria sulphuraria]|uniref:thiamine phosphate synthase n=1 Tax=Galdieria sulphuraria TaxID=130081 RepID=M2XGG1_GALSU|nr:thiamine-phosphate pyrophosphorylase [Galdieria sulphuraria]EME29142.1 thiamine-phosphate pyrophosphorylase [Galdieria sulphuraria]GJD11488.1 Thiamine-phosphate synthase [Galdieria sulphuraria]|eukprot:XP_005705662.1 thiamine-phosphate pyrophosphorylase [Galdieria sulphuraria]
MDRQRGYLLSIISFLHPISLFSPKSFKFLETRNPFRRTQYSHSPLYPRKEARALPIKATQDSVDYSLYLVTSGTDKDIDCLLEKVKAALSGGVTILQYRDKHNSTRDMIRMGKELLHLAHSFQVPLLLNDRVDVALAIDADGVHIGQDDMPLVMARRLLGYGKIIGVSVGNEEEAIVAEQQGANYVGVGSIFATFSKADAGEPIGLQALRSIASAVSSIPVIAIGGINEQNASQCIQNGAKGVAVISAILSSNDPQQAAINLKKQIVHL